MIEKRDYLADVLIFQFYRSQERKTLEYCVCLYILFFNSKKTFQKILFKASYFARLFDNSLLALSIQNVVCVFCFFHYEGYILNEKLESMQKEYEKLPVAPLR